MHKIFYGASEFFDYLIDNNIVINCRYLREARRLLEFFEENGVEWYFHKERLTERTRWCGRGTCYRIILQSDGYKLLHSSAKYYRERCYNILKSDNIVIDFGRVMVMENIDRNYEFQSEEDFINYISSNKELKKKHMIFFLCLNEMV